MRVKISIDDRIDNGRAKSTADGASREGETCCSGKKSVGRGELDSCNKKGEWAGRANST